MPKGDLNIMVRLSLRALCALSALLTSVGVANADTKPAYQLIPGNAQAVVWIPDGDELAERWSRTQLAKLAEDPAVRPFFEDQRQAIEDRLIEAGWRLNVRPQDLSQHLNGQLAIAWLSVESSPRKPFALALLADVEDDAILNRALLDQIDIQLKPRQPAKTELVHEGVRIVKYTMPKRPGQLLAEDSYYAIAQGQFVATDDEQLVKDLIDRVQSPEIAEGMLNGEADFVESRAKLSFDGDAQIEYFVRPIGFAKVLRAIAGKRSKSSTDILAVLENQGFTAIRAVSGEITLGQELLDMQHHGFVLADMPLPLSAAILDFPNKSSDDIPNFVGESVSSFLATNWNAGEAFWKVEGLVDALAGTEGVFKNVIEGIKKDPNGPRIDILADVLPQFTNDIFSVSDSKTGKAEIDSRRNLIALKVKDTEAMRRVVDRAMMNEPDAEVVEFQGKSIWKVVHREDEEVVDLGSDFGEFGAPAGGNAPAPPAPLLSNWAITVEDGYLMFASHPEMIEEAIVQLSAGTPSPLLKQVDFQRLKAAMVRFFGDEPVSTRQIVRNSLAYRVQYELFREGKLKESQSMLASILDRLLDKDSEIRGETQRVDGKNLPPFETIAPFLQPGGFIIRSTDEGWMFGGILLSDKTVAPAAKPTEFSGGVTSGTARASTTVSQEKR